MTFSVNYNVAKVAYLYYTVAYLWNFKKINNLAMKSFMSEGKLYVVFITSL